MNANKIAIIVQRYGPQINGGAEVHARMIAEKLKDKYDVTVLTSRAVDYHTWEPILPVGEAFENGVRVIRFDHPPKGNRKELHLLNRKIRGRRWYQKLYRFLGAPSWYLRSFPQSVLKEEEENKFFELQGPLLYQLPDYLLQHQSEYACYVFFTYLYYPTAIGMPLVGNKSIFIPTIHDEPPIYFPIFKKIIPAARWIFFNTDSERRFSEKLFDLTNNKKETVAVGISPVSYVHDEVIEKKYASLGTYILYVGRIDVAKGCDRLIDFFIKYSDRNKTNIALLMVGNSYMKKTDHPNIHYLGFVSDNEKAYLMTNALFLAIPSLYESLSLVLLESFFLRTPVVVNEKCDVLKEHIEKSGGGLTFSDYDQFKDAIDTLIKNPGLRDKMSSKGLEYVLSNYTWKTVLDKFDVAIHDIKG